MASAAVASSQSALSDVPLRSGTSRPTVKVATLPKGTILFRAICLQSPTEDPRGQDLFQDLLGYPVGDAFCLSPTHGVYCFAIPYVGFGIYDWTRRTAAWRKYNAFMVYALTEDTQFIVLIRPAAEVRGTPKGWRNGDLIARCDKFPPTTCYRGLPNENARRAAFQKAQAWDNCLDPVRRTEEDIGGWIAVAEGDSIDVTESKGRRMRAKLTPMGAYLSSMNAVDLADTLPHMVVDARGTRGFPEIVVSPWRAREAGVGLQETLIRPTAGFEDNVRMVTEDLAAGHLIIAPVATITATGFYFYDSLGFRHEGLGAGEEPRNMSPEARRERIEKNSYELMTRLGRGEVDGFPAATFDRHTGFFVIGGAGMDGRMGLRTGADWGAVRRYCIHVKGGIAGSEYLFQRPPSIRGILRDLEIPFEGNSKMARVARDLVAAEGGTGGRRYRDAAADAAGAVNAVDGTAMRLHTQTRKTLGILNRNLGKTAKNKKTATTTTVAMPNPEIISIEAEQNLGELYSGLGATVKAIFVN